MLRFAIVDSHLLLSNLCRGQALRAQLLAAGLKKLDEAQVYSDANNI